MNFLYYFLWLLKEIARSSINVTKIIWSRNLKLNPKADWIHTKLKADIKKVIYANSITLTPGTVTINLEDDKLFVHSLEEDGLKDLENGTMENKIC